MEFEVRQDNPGVMISYSTCQCEINRQEYLRLGVMTEQAAIPPFYRGFTFSTWDRLPESQSGNKPEARAAAVDFLRNPHGTLVLSGSVGVGKSGLAACIANERLRQGRSILWVDFSELINIVRDTYNVNSEVSYMAVIRSAQTAPLLILDDCGQMNTQKSASDDTRRIMYDVINSRYTHELPTIITTNLDQIAFRRLFDDRTGDRVEYNGTWINLTGVNLRVNYD
jgi:DNA replication protein DnaC